MLSILYDDFDQKVKNIHDKMDLLHSYKKKRVALPVQGCINLTFLRHLKAFKDFCFRKIFYKNCRAY